MNDATDVRCWLCDVPLDPESVEREGFLVPRRTAEGGPLWMLRCPHCETENGAERNRAGEFLLVPCVPRGFGGWLAALFDLRRTRLRARARVWWRRNRKRRRAHHAKPPRSRPAEPTDEEPPPRPGPAPDVEPEPERPESEPAPPADDPRDRIVEHYETLDVPLTASRDEIAAAYRRLSQLCHPDKVAHLDEEFQELAEQKFRRLREAYEAIVDALD
jgi:DnaJ-domain-containing protein 1